MRSQFPGVFLLYRYRFLALYVVFGILSLIVELFIVRTLNSFHINQIVSALLGFLSGLIVAFTLNIRFNFHIAPPKRTRALLYFFIISSLSFCVQLLLRQELIRRGISVDFSRFIIAGGFFMISYLLHRRFSFKEYKKVGVAIYADGVEDIKNIYNKISMICDFIHIDIVDKTFKENCADVKAYRAEVVRAYWQNKPIEVHIMSKKPSNWLPELLPYVNVIYIHANCEENLLDVFDAIRKGGCEPGLVIGVDEQLEDFEKYISEVKHLLVLSIKNPGSSGQEFDISVLSLIETLNLHKRRSDFTICIDGGINDNTIQYLNVESVVSGSYILNSETPKKNIIHLQTSGEYGKF